MIIWFEICDNVVDEFRELLYNLYGGNSYEIKKVVGRTAPKKMVEG